MRCPCNTIPKKFVPPYGTKTPRIYIAGMVPGREESEQGITFIGPAGQVLRSALTNAEIDIESEVRMFNAVACRTTQEGNPNLNRDPTPEEVENCKEYIYTDIEKCQPQIILVMGRTAATAFLDPSQISSVGSMMKETYDFKGIPLKVGYHPSYILKNGGVNAPQYNEYVNWFKKFSTKVKYEYELNSLNIIDADQFLSWEPPSDHLGFDIEASSLDTTGEEFFVCGLGFSDIYGNGTYVYLRSEDEMSKISDKLRSIIKNNTLYVFNFAYEGTAMATKLQIHPYEWNMMDTRQSALATARKGSLKVIAQSLGFPDWETENSWVITCIEDLYKHIFTKSGKKEKPPLTRLKESWQLFCESLKEENSSLYEKAIYLENLYKDDPCLSIELLRSKFIFEADRRNDRMFFDLVPINVISSYCAFDAYAAVKVHQILWDQMDDLEKQSVKYLNEHSELGAAITCTGIGWNTEKARQLNTYYKEKLVSSMKSFLTNPLTIQVLNFSTHDVIKINSCTDFNTLKDYFNLNSNHITTRQAFSKIMNQKIGKRVHTLFTLYTEVNLTPESKFIDLKKMFIHLLREDPDPQKMKKIREEKREFINGDEENIKDIIKLYTDEEGKFHGSKFLGMLYYFEFDKLDEFTISPLYDAFNRIGGIDIDDQSTWPLEFKVLIDFRIFRKVYKSFSTYLWGSVGMREDVRLIKSEDSDKISPPRINTNWDLYINKGESLDGYKAVATWSYNVNGAETNRWKGRYHVWPWQCELQDLKTSRYKTGLLAHVDYSQMEIRTIAALAGETELLKAYETGKDVHRFMASKVFDRPEELIDDTERRYSKMLTFSVLYGKTEHGVAIEFLGGDFEKAKNLVRGFYTGFPKIAEFVQSQHQSVDDGVDYVRSILGEKILLRIIGQSGSEKARIAQLKRYSVNYPIQSSASHLAGIGINRVNRESFERGLSIKAFGFTHDAGDYDFDAKDLFHFLDVIKRNMQDNVLTEFNIPVKVDIEIGVTGNNMMEFDVHEVTDKKLIVEAKGSLQSLRDIKQRLEGAGINYNLKIHSIKEDYMSHHFMFMLKRAFSEKLGQHYKSVKVTFEIFNPGA